MEKSVVVAIEDRRLRAILRSGLDAAGFRVYTATTGAEALNWITSLGNCSNPASLIVMNTQLGALSGRNLIDRIRDAGIDMPIVIVAGCGRPAWLGEAKDLHRVETVSTPVNMKEMMCRIEELLGPGGCHEDIGD
jgi:DNA-binding response OmpR family regulator